MHFSITYFRSPQIEIANIALITSVYDNPRSLELCTRSLRRKMEPQLWGRPTGINFRLCGQPFTACLKTQINRNLMCHHLTARVYQKNQFQHNVPSKS